MTLRDAIARLLVDPEDAVLARSIIGTTDVEAIAANVEAFVRRELADPVVACPRFTQSVGAVLVLVLASGRRVVMKIHALGSAGARGLTRDELAATYAAQHELAQRGLRCASVICPPAPFDGVGDDRRCAAIMAELAAGVADDPHDPGVRRALARELARTVELGRSLSMRDRLPRSTLPMTLFPPPHNALFDFTAPGGEWIDERARAARAVLDTVPAHDVVMHSDFSCANVKVVDGEVVAIYDMDSVCWTDEMRCLASAAVHFTYAGDPPWTLPSVDEARAFVADYVEARGRPLAAGERARLDAAAIYAIAYTARCEHGHTDARRTGTMRHLLAATGDSLF